jgi:hypothetical protein
MNQAYARTFYTEEEAEIEFEKRIRALAALDAEGKNESSEADEIREEMDVPWLAMSDAGQRRMRRLSDSLQRAAEAKAARQEEEENG